MATPYTDIYKRFRSKIRDYEELDLTDSEIEESDFERLKSARTKFKGCKKLKSKNDLLMQYDNELDDEEIEIYATLMILEWLNPRIATLENLKVHMSNKDFNINSQANHLKTLLELRQIYKKESSELLVSYSYNFFNDL